MRRMIFRLLPILLLCAFLCVNVHAEGQNLISQGDSDMSNIQSWTVPYKGKLTTVDLDNSSNKCLCFTRTEVRSWDTPAINLLPLLLRDLMEHGSGEYGLEFDFLVTNFDKTDREISFNCLVRSTNKLTMTDGANNNSTEFRGSFGRMLGVKANQWHHFSNTVSFYREEITFNGSWMMCFDAIPDEMECLYLDNVRLYRIGDASGGTIGKVSVTGGYGGESGQAVENPDISGVEVATAAPTPEPGAEKELFAPRIGQTAIIVAGVTVGLVAIGTALRVRKYRNSRKKA